MADFESSTLDERHKVLFRFIDKVNDDSPRTTAADLDIVRAAGWTDEAIYFAITVILSLIGWTWLARRVAGLR